MPVSVNRVILAGNVTRDPQKRYIGYGTAITEFTLAIDRRRAKQKDSTDYVEITAWGELGETCDAQVRKGASVLVQGELRTRSYEKNGETRRVTEVVISTLDFLTPKARPMMDHAVPEEHMRDGGERSP
jgi:single-strand DNA-binding protein